MNYGWRFVTLYRRQGSRPSPAVAAAAAAAAASLQSCPTLCDPIDGSPPGSSVPGILQARTLEWAAFPSPRGFPYFLQFKSEFGNKEIMILATVSSQSYFC